MPPLQIQITDINKPTSVGFACVAVNSIRQVIPLIASGFIKIGKLKTFYPDEREYLFQSLSTHEEGVKLYQKYQHLNSFLKAKCPESTMFTFRFWDYTQVFIVGKSAENDRVGLKLTSEFDYNP